MMTNEDYVFHVNWEDRHKQLHKIGILAQIDKYFYLIIKEQTEDSSAYKSGFIGVPGFNKEEVYRSGELFDFFRNRILESKRKNPCEELSKTGGISMTDSFSVEEISKRISKKYKKIILEAYELQERKKKIQEEKHVEESENINKKICIDEIRDI